MKNKDEEGLMDEQESAGRFLSSVLAINDIMARNLAAYACRLSLVGPA
jgi:hypothetical protein